MPEKLEDAAMSLAELLPAIRALPREEKTHLVQLLVDDLSPRLHTGSTSDDERLEELFPPGARFVIGTPPESYEAARILLDMLERAKGK